MKKNRKKIIEKITKEVLGIVIISTIITAVLMIVVLAEQILKIIHNIN